MTQIINSTVLGIHLLLQEVHPIAPLSKLTQPIVPSWLIYHQVNTKLPHRPVLLYGQEEAQAWVPWQLYTLPRTGPSSRGEQGEEIQPSGSSHCTEPFPPPQLPNPGLAWQEKMQMSAKPYGR